MILTNVIDTIHADSLALFALNIESLLADVNTVSEKWFHDLNSQNEFLPYRQNKIFKCVHKLFYLCEWRNNSCNTY